jgi:hypothetical protein
MSGLKNCLRDGVAVADSKGSLVSNLRIQGDDFPKQYLGRTLPTWIIEYGLPTCAPATRPEHYNCVAPREQAAFHARGWIIGFSKEFASVSASRGKPDQTFRDVSLITSTHGH